MQLVGGARTGAQTLWSFLLRGQIKFCLYLMYSQKMSSSSSSSGGGAAASSGAAAPAAAALSEAAKVAALPRPEPLEEDDEFEEFKEESAFSRFVCARVQELPRI